MATTSDWRRGRLIGRFTVLAVAYLLVMANSIEYLCRSSRDFEGVFEVTSDCGITEGEPRSGRVRIFAAGSEQESEGEWETTVSTLSGDEIIAGVVAGGGCKKEEPAKVTTFKLYLAPSASNSTISYVCGSAVYGTIDTTCDEIRECTDCEELKNACTISLVAIEPAS